MVDAAAAAHSAPGSPAAVAALWRIGAATMLVVLAFSIVSPLLAVELQRHGTSASAIGFFGMLSFAVVALMVPAMPALFARLGVMRVYRFGLALEAASIAGYALSDSYASWCACSVVGALGAAAAWNGTEALIAFNAPADRRGRFTGLYQTALGAALALGPFAPGLLTRWQPAALASGPAPLLWAAVAMFAIALGIVITPAVGRLTASRSGARRTGLWPALRAAKALALLAFAGGVFEAGLGGITAAYGSGLGLTLAQATSLAGVLGIGSFLLQYPAGWLADHVPLRRVFTVVGFVLLGSALVFAFGTRWIACFWLAAFLWGAAGGALYTLVMVRVARQFASTSTMAATAAMITAYTAGAAAGPLVSGLLLDAAGAFGQAAWLAMLAAGVLAVARSSAQRA